MKKSIYTLLLVVFTSLVISACADENIRPRDGGGTAYDPCQYGGPGCPKQ